MNANEFIDVIASAVVKKLAEDKKPISMEQLMTNFAKGQIKANKDNKYPVLDEPMFKNARDRTLWHYTQVLHQVTTKSGKSYTLGGYKLLKEGITEKRQWQSKGQTKTQVFEKVILEKNGQQEERLVTNGGFKLSPIFGELIA